MSAQVLKVDEGLHCVEFMKKEGPKMGYLETFKQAKTFFAGHVNA